MFQSDFDPPQRAHSVLGLLGIVAVVLCGIGLTVHGYLSEEGAPEARTRAETVVEPTYRRAPDLPAPRVEPVQHRSRPQAASGSRSKTSGKRSRQIAPVAVPLPATPAAEKATASKPHSQADAGTGQEQMPTADI